MDTETQTVIVIIFMVVTAAASMGVNAVSLVKVLVVASA